MTASIHTFPDITPRWAVPFADLVEVFVLATPRLQRFDYPAHPLVFACSSNGIWPTTSLGPTAPGDRVMVDGRSVLLDAIAQQMMRRHDSATGGRFTVTLDGAFRTRDNLCLAHIELSS